MKEVYVNGRFLTQEMTGIQRFSYEICKALISRGMELIILSPGKTRPEYSLDCRIVRFGIFSGILWEQLDLPLFLLRHKNPLLVNFGSPGPLLYANRIVTVHDLSFYIHPEWFSKSYYLYYRLVTPVALRLSRKVITVSEFSKKEIMRLTRTPEEKIAVVHNAGSILNIPFPCPPSLPAGKGTGDGYQGNSPAPWSESGITTEIPRSLRREDSFAEKQESAERERGRYILTVASMDPRKNLERLVEAYRQAGIDGGIKLMLAGKTDRIFNMEFPEGIIASSVGYVPDEELAALYSRAEVFVYPSLYEGFGIPPLEAMSLGCPVVLSDIPVFREIFGDAACYVDPYDAGSISKGILRVLNNEPYRKELIARGLERARLFGWDRSAEKLAGIINTLA